VRLIRRLGRGAVSPRSTGRRSPSARFTRLVGVSVLAVVTAVGVSPGAALATPTGHGASVTHLAGTTPTRTTADSAARGWVWVYFGSYRTRDQCMVAGQATALNFSCTYDPENGLWFLEVLIWVCGRSASGPAGQQAACGNGREAV
jgi:hypothetical protein